MILSKNKKIIATMGSLNIGSNSGNRYGSVNLKLDSYDNEYAEGAEPTKSFSENVNLDFKSIEPFTSNTKFKTAEEHQEALEKYYFKWALKNSAYGLIDWE